MLNTKSIRPLTKVKKPNRMTVIKFSIALMLELGSGDRDQFI